MSAAFDNPSKKQAPTLKPNTMGEKERKEIRLINIGLTLLILGVFLATYVLDTNIQDALATANNFQKIFGVVMFIGAIVSIWKLSGRYSMGRFTPAAIGFLLAGLAPLVVACHTL